MTLAELPSLTDIAFHPNGTLYGCSFGTIFELDTTMFIFPASYKKIVSGGWGDSYFSGMTIDHTGLIWLCGYKNSIKALFTYNIKSNQFKEIGPVLPNDYQSDLEWYNGDLYAITFDRKINRIKLTRININNPANSIDTYVSDTLESWGLASVNDECHSYQLIATSGTTYWDPRGLYFFNNNLDSMQYKQVAALSAATGATSRTSWLGSFTPLGIDSISILHEGGNCSLRSSLTAHIRRGYYIRPDIEYSLDGITYQTDSVFHGLSPGKYVVQLKDSLGCFYRSDSIEIKAAPTFAYSDLVEADYCGLATGSIRLRGSGIAFAPEGLGFSQDSLLLSRLSAGNQDIILKNSSGCLDTLTLTVPGIAPFTVAALATTDTCGRGKGSVLLTPSGNRGALSLSLDSINYSPGTSWQGLSSGDYDLFIQDSAGCVISQTIHINDIPPPQINNLIETDPGCNSANGTISVQATTPGVLFALNGNTNTTGLFNDLSAGDYTLFLTDSLGCMSDTSITLTGRNAPIISDVSIQDAHCSQENGSLTIGVSPSDTVQISIDSLHFFSELSFDSLAAGDYTLFVRNAAGCITTTKITIAQTGLPHFDNLEIKEPSCDSINGAIRVSGSGHAPLSYTLEGNTANTAGYFGHLSEGVYNLAIADVYGCTIDTLIPLEHRGSAAVGDISVSPGSCGDRFSVLHLAGQADNSYILPQVGRTAYPGDTLHLSPGDYRLIISNTICSLDTVITIPHSDCPYFIPNVFSPNHDGINDVFKPEGKIDLIALEIFNRWGDHIYTGHGTQAAWDGRFKGKELPPGVYIYWMRIRKADGSESMAKGEVTLLR